MLGLRRGKGMVLDADDHDTWSAGSFFTNPFLTPEQAAALPADAPRWEQPDGTVKSSAGWLTSAVPSTVYDSRASSSARVSVVMARRYPAGAKTGTEQPGRPGHGVEESTPR